MTDELGPTPPKCVPLCGAGGLTWWRHEPLCPMREYLKGKGDDLTLPEPVEPHRLTWRVPSSLPWSREIGPGTVKLNNDPLYPVHVTFAGGPLDETPRFTVEGTLRMVEPIVASGDRFTLELALTSDILLHDLLRLFGFAHIEPAKPEPEVMYRCVDCDGEWSTHASVTPCIARGHKVQAREPVTEPETIPIRRRDDAIDLIPESPRKIGDRGDGTIGFVDG